MKSDARRRRNFARVLKRDNHVCQYCGADADGVDHITPWSLTGDNSMENLVAACRPCNSKAHDGVWPSFQAKRDWVRSARKLKGPIPPGPDFDGEDQQVEYMDWGPIQGPRLPPVKIEGEILPMAVTNLRLRMMEDGRTQIEIAKAAGFPPSRISEYALGRKKIPHHHLLALSLTLRCNPQDVQGFAEEIVL